MNHLVHNPASVSGICEQLWETVEKNIGQEINPGQRILVSWKQARGRPMVLYTLEKDSEGNMLRMIKEYTTSDFPDDWEYVVCPNLPTFIE
jgi:hypothetical protein